MNSSNYSQDDCIITKVIGKRNKQTGIEDEVVFKYEIQPQDQENSKKIKQVLFRKRTLKVVSKQKSDSLIRQQALKLGHYILRLTDFLKAG